jgi:prevent-host-death family protein
MFSVRGPAVIATVSELKAKTKESLGAASRGPVYVVRDGQPVAGIVSIEMMAVLEEALEDRRLAGIAAKRMNSIRSGEDTLLEEGEFWNAVEARQTAPGVRRPGRKTAAG